MHVAIFSETTRSDFSHDQPEQSALILFGSGNFDLTKRPLGLFARLGVCAIFGAVKIIVPAGTRVVTDGMAVFGAATMKGTSESGPEFRLRYFVLFGSVEVVESKAAPLPLATTAGTTFPF